MSTSTLQNLVDALVAIEESMEIPKVDYLHSVMMDGTVFQPKDEFDGVEAGSSHPLVEHAIGLACEELITNNGGCNLTNIDALRSSGFTVFPGETDSFGWLTGCIRTKKGILVYG